MQQKQRGRDEEERGAHHSEKDPRATKTLTLNTPHLGKQKPVSEVRERKRESWRVRAALAKPGMILPFSTIMHELGRARVSEYARGLASMSGPLHDMKRTSRAIRGLAQYDGGGFNPAARRGRRMTSLGE